MKETLLETHGLTAFAASLKSLIASNKAIISQLEFGLRWQESGALGEGPPTERVAKALSDLRQFTQRVEELEKQLHEFEAD